MADPVCLVILDLTVLVLLCMGPQLLRAFLVLEADRVGISGGTSLARPGKDAALSHVAGQRPRWHLFGVVDAPGDDGAVGVSLEEVDDHFLTDARDVDHAPVLARPRVAHAHPAGAVLVLLVVAIPVEMYLHAPIVVGIDLISRGAYDQCGLHTLHHRFRGEAPRSKRDFAGQGSEAAIVAGGAASIERLIVAVLEMVTRGHYEVLAVLLGAWISSQLEQFPRTESTRIGVPARELIV